MPKFQCKLRVYVKREGTPETWEEKPGDDKTWLGLKEMFSNDEIDALMRGFAVIQLKVGVDLMYRLKKVWTY